MSATSSVNPATAPITQADLEEHTIQGLIELSYIKVANDVLSDSLQSLQSALTLTNNVLVTLTGLQSLHNKIVVSGRGTFGFNYATGSIGSLIALSNGEYVRNYTTAASAFFGAPIDPKFIYSSAGAPGFNSFQQELIINRDQLAAQIPLLSATTPTLSGGVEDPNSLLAKLRKVLADLDRYDLNTFEGVRQWVVDKYDEHGSTGVAAAGQIQQNLTFAITAGQSLNNTQTETVRRYLFLFEEYYKSASAVLQAINQIIQKMADAITTT